MKKTQPAKPAPPKNEVEDSQLRRVWHTATEDQLFRAMIPGYKPQEPK